MEEHDDKIYIHLPAEPDLVKSESGDRRCVKGFAATQDIDRHKEELLLKGLDFADLADHGHINYDHQRVQIAGARMPIIIGWPTHVEMKLEKGLWVEGELINGDPMASELNRLANEMWELGIQLKKSGGNRSLAYSIEGGVVQRRGKKLVRTKANMVALTHKPVNPACTVEMFAKSLCCGRCSPDHPEYNPAHSCSNKAVEIEDGLPHLGQRLEKAADTAGYGALLKENLDRHLSKVLYGDGECDCYDRKTGRFYKSITGAFHHMTDCLGYGREDTHKFLRRLVRGSEKSADLAALAKTAGLLRQ